MNTPAKVVTRDELYAAVWSKTLKALAGEWNTEYPRLVQACAAMEVPRPSAGYWQWIANGYIPEKEPLGPRNESIPNEWALLPKGVRTEKRPVVQKPPAPKVLPKKPVAQSPVPVEKPTEIDLAALVQKAVLDMIRQADKINFWLDDLTEKFYPGRLASWIGLTDSDKIPESRLVAAVKNTRADYTHFVVRVVEYRDHRYAGDDYHLTVAIHLRDEYEWLDACKEAWTYSETPNAYGLSDNALRFYEWTQGPKYTDNFVPSKKLGGQARLRKTYNHIDDHVEEIRIKVDPTIRMETKGGFSNREFRIWFEQKQEHEYDYGPLNPGLDLNLRTVQHADLEKFRTWLYQEIQKPEFPLGTETIGVFDIRDRKTLKSVWKYQADHVGRYSPMADFFDTLRLRPEVELRYSFEGWAGPWLVTCQPKSNCTWKKIKAQLAEAALAIPLEKRYSLSAHARALLEWILELHPDEFLAGMTPVVEKRLGVEIGFKTGWNNKHTRIYLELLIEEINEQTEYQLRAMDWWDYPGEGTRILVKRKKTDMAEVVRAVQLLGLKQGKLLSANKVKALLDGLLAAA